MKKRSIRLLSLLLAAAMCLSAAPLSVFAEGDSGTAVSGTPTVGSISTSAPSGTPAPSGTQAPVPKTYTVTVTNGTPASSTVTEGQKVTITAADSDNFLYWKGQGLTKKQRKKNPLTLKPSSDLNLEAVNKQPILTTTVTVDMQFLNGDQVFTPSDVGTPVVHVMLNGELKQAITLKGSDTEPITLARNDEAGNQLTYDLVLQGEAAKKFTLKEETWRFTQDTEERTLSLKANPTECTVKVEEKLLDFFPNRELKLKLFSETIVEEEAKSQEVSQKDCVLNHDQLQHNWTELPAYAGNTPAVYLPKVVFEGALGIKDGELTCEKQADGSYLISHPDIEGEVSYEDIPVSIQWNDENGEPGGEPEENVKVLCTLKSGGVTQSFDSLELAASLKKTLGKWEGSISVPRTTLKGDAISFTLTVDEAMKSKYTWENPGDNVSQFTLKKKPAPPRIQAEFQNKDGESEAAPVDSITLKIEGNENQTAELTLQKDQAWTAELPEWVTAESVLTLSAPVAAYKASFSVEGKLHKVILKRDADLTYMKVSAAFQFGAAPSAKFPKGQKSLTVEILDGENKLAEAVLTEAAPSLTCELPAGKTYKLNVPDIPGFTKGHSLGGNSDLGMDAVVTYTAEPKKIEAKLSNDLIALVPKAQILKIQVKNGEETAAEIALTRDNPSGFASLPAYNENGEPIVYTVPETQGDLKVTENADGIYVAALSTQPEMAEKKVSAEFLTKTGDPKYAPAGIESFQVKILGRAKGSGEAFAEVKALELLRNEKFTDTVSLAKKDLGGRDMEYELTTTETVEHYERSIENGEKELKLVFRNLLNEDTVSVSFHNCYGGTVSWPVDQVELKLKASSLTETLTLKKNPDASTVSQKVVLPGVDEEGNELTWTLEVPQEITVNGFTYVPKVSGFTVVYTAKARIQIRAYWKDGNDRLIQAPEEQAELKLTWDTGSENLVVNQDNKWIAETVVPGHQAPYTVEVLSPGGYDVKVTGPWKNSHYDYILNVDLRQAVPLKAMLKREQVGMETHRIRLKVQRSVAGGATEVLPEELELNSGNRWMDHYPDGVQRFDPAGEPYEYKLVPLNSDFEVTGNLDDGFVVERVNPNEKKLNVTIVWKNKNGEIIDAPSRYKELDIGLHGYHDFDVTADWEGKVTLTSAGKWKLQATVPAKDAEDRDLKYKATLVSLTPVGYKFSVEGQGTDNIVITLQAKKLSLIPSTGDQFAMGLWLLLGGGALVGLGVYGVISYRKKKKNK